MRYSTVSVIGLGYIGLPTAAVLASRKVKVVGVDVSQNVVNTVNQGGIHIVEPDLDIVVRAAVTEGYLRATNQPEAADAFLIAVPTPFKGDHEPDLSYVESATLSIAPVLKAGDLIVLESTSPVGTTDLIAQWLKSKRPDLTFPGSEDASPDVNIAHCPERVLPGHVLTELINNDRVIGGMTAICAERAIELYRTFAEGEMLVTDARTAEMCKLVENSYRDVNIAFANELSIICEKASINVWELIKLANHHPRVSILQPGTGVGGHCIAVDPWFIVSQAGEDAALIRTARTINDRKPRFVAEDILAHHSTAGTESISLFGLSFKPDIDDLRESPAVLVAAILIEAGVNVKLVEPHISSLPEDLQSASLISLDEALAQNNSTRAFLVAHAQFKELPDDQKLGVLDYCGVSAN